jgi:glycosyltransferase involved in cell wall biosynthesis
MQLSVVVPVYNEKDNLERLYEEVVAALEKLGQSFEVVLIDDGSSDGSLTILEALQQRDPRVVVIAFRRNFGQTAALSAGFDHARGDTIVTMDADLQNDPADIPLLLTKMAEGYDLVNGWRHRRKDPFLSRKLPSMIANKIISLTTGVRLHDYGCTLKAFRREITDNIRLYGEMHRFIPAIASAMGVSIAEVKVNHRERWRGSSKYGISRTVRVLLDLITVKFLLTYATRPIQIFGLLGFASGFCGFALALLITIQRQFYGIPVANRPLLLLAILLIFIGFQFITLGLLGELQVRTYHEAQNKPIYVIKRFIRSEG